VNSALVERWLPPGTGTTLKTDLWDEAMGEGLYAAIAARSERVVGVDVARAIVIAAAERYPDLDARVAHVHALPFEDGSFDAIVSNSTLDHFDDASEIDRSVLELARVLRPGGTLILTLDNPANPLVALASARRKPPPPRPVAVMIGHRIHGGGGFLRALAALERLEHAPTRYVTGHFIAVRATRLA